MKYPKLSKGYDFRGAFMGRRNSIEEPNEPIKFRLYKMPLSSSGCCDPCKILPGSLENSSKYHAYGDGKEMFIRAKDRQDAKEQVKKVFGNCKFFR